MNAFQQGLVIGWVLGAGFGGVIVSWIWDRRIYPRTKKGGDGA